MLDDGVATCKKELIKNMHSSLFSTQTTLICCISVLAINLPCHLGGMLLVQFATSLKLEEIPFNANWNIWLSGVLSKWRFFPRTMNWKWTSLHWKKNRSNEMFHQCITCQSFVAFIIVIFFSPVLFYLYYFQLVKTLANQITATMKFAIAIL